MKKRQGGDTELLVFYSFNGNMEHDELVRQLRELAAQGVTGFFVHARAGLEIAYMQEEWFACFQLCVDTAEELGMSVYIYDENGWPSGFCGGAIPALGEAYQYKYLAFSRGVPPGEAGHRVIAAYACEEGGCRRISDGEITDSSLVAYYGVDENYVDLLCRDTVKEFIARTHEVYKERFGRYFGSVIKGAFTDYRQPTAFDFANRFRSGEMPVAVSDYTAQNQLSVFAPEIKGQREMRPLPGVRDGDTINRTVASTATGCVIMRASEHQEAAWKFLDWWTSTRIQTLYGNELETVMGTAARYNSANREAFEQLPWEPAMLRTILAQWEDAKALPEIPGGYYTSRYFDFATRDVITNGENPRETLGEIAKEIDAEIANIPVTNNDLDKTVPIFNALARPMEGYEGEDWWLEDMQYEYFHEGDAKSTQLYETILDSSVLDIGTGIADMFAGINHVVRCSVLWRYETPNSYLNSSEGNYEIYIDAMFNR